MGGLRIVVSKSEMAAHIVAQVHVGILVGGRATDGRHVDGLRIVGTKSEVAAHVEAQVYVWA